MDGGSLSQDVGASQPPSETACLAGREVNDSIGAVHQEASQTTRTHTVSRAVDKTAEPVKGIHTPPGVTHSPPTLHPH